jgi:hypothetical protein
VPDLARLDSIPWAQLEGPYGTSEGVPAAIRSLWSGGEGERAGAVGELQEKLWHQGTVYEVTAPAVPFIAEAALGDVVGRDDRIWLILLLAWIAGGTSRWAGAARDAAKNSLPGFLERLDAETDPGLQIALVDLAAQFPEDAEASRPRISRLLDGEDEEPRRVVLEVALAALGADVDRDDLLERLPRDYYGQEEITDLRHRFEHDDDELAVYRELLQDISGAVITLERE